MPNCLVTPMFAQDVCWIEIAREMINVNDPCSNRFSNMMKGESIVTLVKFVEGVLRNDRAVNNSLIVPKNITLAVDWNPKVMKRSAKINDLINTCPCSNEFRAIGSCLNSCLLLRVALDWSLVEEMQDPSDRMPCQHVME